MLYILSNYIYDFILSPIYLLYILWRIKDKPHLRKTKYAAFTIAYKDEYLYYEVIMMLRRILIIIALIRKFQIEHDQK